MRVNISATSLQNADYLQKISDIKSSPIKANDFAADPKVDFSKTLISVLNSVNDQQVSATSKIDAVELGKSDDMIGAVIAAQKASLSFSALIQVRNKLLSSFDEVMKMSV
ncbi:MAG: flagellar hook-basal body complex protein FliE [Psychromonas sp.]|jgi:flagellar hook-basal body complex protein FliE